MSIHVLLFTFTCTPVHLHMYPCSPSHVPCSPSHVPLFTFTCTPVHLHMYPVHLHMYPCSPSHVPLFTFTCTLFTFTCTPVHLHMYPCSPSHVPCSPSHICTPLHALFTLTFTMHLHFQRYSFISISPNAFEAVCRTVGINFNGHLYF